MNSPGYFAASHNVLLQNKFLIDCVYALCVLCVLCVFRYCAFMYCNKLCIVCIYVLCVCMYICMYVCMYIVYSMGKQYFSFI